AGPADHQPTEKPMSRFTPPIAALVALAAVSGAPRAEDSVTFGTNWKAEAEHGGYYQAVATGIYKKHGLNVTIRQGGPAVNHAQLLAAGRIDFNMGDNCFSALNFVKENIPMVVVGATFQKDPAVLMAHPGTGAENLKDLKGRPAYIGAATRTGWWLWLQNVHGFSDDQIRPYTFNLAPWLADKRAAVQGFATSEPYSAALAGVKPVVHLLADNGYDSYNETIETSLKLAREKPDLVQRFVDASIEGWYGYLYGDPSPGNALIKKDNPEMTDDLIAFGVKAMKAYGIVDSGDARTMGIGAMSDARWKRFFDFAVKAGVYDARLDYKKAYTLQFVNKKVGMAK
ncbi:MAG: ABC transporter substrate-binding protein, partial [Rhodospirillales bacterium]